MRLLLVGALVLFCIAAPASANDLIRADGTDADPDGHEHKGLLPLSGLACGDYVSGASGSGETFSSTGYDFVASFPGTPDTAGRLADHRWVAVDKATAIWDMGEPVSSVAVVPGIDHADLPGEALEYTALGSDSRSADPAAEQGDITVIYDKGVSDYVSDDFSARWDFKTPHRYVQVIAGGPGAMLADGDAEIDAVCKDLPAPTSGQTANLVPASGSVAVKLPDTATFAPLPVGDQIPVSSVVDTTKGSVKITTANTAGALQSVAFSGGSFKLLQAASTSGLTSVRLQGGKSRTICRTSTKSAARSARRRKPKKSVLNKLFGTGHGVYTADGRHAKLTITGTRFSIADRCDGTLVTLFQGKGTVFDKVRHKTVRLRAGRSYLASAR